MLHTPIATVRPLRYAALLFAAAFLHAQQNSDPITVTAADGTVIAVTAENANRVAGSMVLYSPNWGYTTGTNSFGTEVLLTPSSDAERYQVTGLNSYLLDPSGSGNSAVANGLVLSGAPGAQAQLLFSHFKIGDTVRFIRPVVRAATLTANSTNTARGTNQLVIYTATFGASTNTNSFGYELTVENGIVTKAGGNNSPIPAAGFVLSGHGTAGDWLSANAIIGSRVALANLNVTISIDPGSYIFGARRALDQTNIAIRDAFAAFINAPLDAAKTSLAEGQARLAQAAELQLSNPPQSVFLAKQASELASTAYDYTLPSRVAEARATWYRPVEKTFAAVIQTLDRMQAGHFNELYIETWFGGYTVYPSTVATNNRIPSQNPAFAGFDPLRAFVDEGRKRGIAVHAWIDGFMVGSDPTGGPVLRAHPEWAARTRAQAVNSQPSPDPSSGYFWMDIVNPEVRQFLLDLTRETVSQYGLAGVDLDYTRFPTASDWRRSFSFSPYARTAYQAYSGIDPYMLDAASQPAQWSAWTSWISDREDEFVQRTYRDMKALSNAVVVSATPEPGTETQAIGKWSQYVDVVIPQAYSLGSVPPLVTEIAGELAPGNLIYAGIYPFYHHESPELTVQEVLSGRELVAGTNIFAFGQANAPAAVALSQGVWRRSAVSTGMHPVQATVEQLNALVEDINSVYLPRAAMSRKTAAVLLANVAGIRHLLSAAPAGVAEARKLLGILEMHMRSAASGDIAPVVATRIAADLHNLENVLVYSATKHIY